MDKPKERLIERRRYIRLEAPLEMTYALPEIGRMYKATTKNISADGLRFEEKEGDLKKADLLEMKIDIPGAANAIHLKGRIVWKSRVCLEDNSPYDVGVEFVEIENDNKNTFLKFLCDLIYSLSGESSDE